MRTTVDLDAVLMEALMARFPNESPARVVEYAIASYLSRAGAEEVQALVGGLEIEDASAAFRSADRSS